MKGFLFARCSDFLLDASGGVDDECRVHGGSEDTGGPPFTLWWRELRSQVAEEPRGQPRGHAAQGSRATTCKYRLFIEI